MDSSAAVAINGKHPRCRILRPPSTLESCKFSVVSEIENIFFCFCLFSLSGLFLPLFAMRAAFFTLLFACGLVAYVNKSTLKQNAHVHVFQLAHIA